MTLIIRVPDATYPADRPALVRYYDSDPFASDGPLPAPWTTYVAGGAPAPAVTGGSLRVKADTATAVSHAWKRIDVPGAGWHCSVSLTASASTLIGGGDAGRLGLTIQPDAGGAGLHAGIYRTTLPNGSYYTWSTWSADGVVAQTGPSGPARSVDLSKAPQIGHRFGVRLAGGSLHITADGVDVATLAAPAWVTTATRLRLGVAATYGADARVDDWRVTS